MLAIGIEIELLLSLRPAFQNDLPATSDLNGFAEFLARAFNTETNGVLYMHADIYGYDGPNAQTEWTVTDDATLDTNEMSSQWPIEIVSPILQYGSDSWRQGVAELWDTLDIICIANTNQSCGTHVHISPGIGLHWDLEHLKRICRGIIYFENAFEALVPEGRRQNEYSKSNRHDNPKLSEKTVDECFSMINACTSNSAIADLLNNGGDRYFSWNLTNLYRGGKLTIEFRRGPGVTDLIACQSWVELAVSFSQAACNSYTIAHMKGYPISVEGLYAFINEGLGLGTDRPRFMASIFQGKTGSIVPARVEHLSAEKQDKLNRKKDQDSRKNLMVKKFIS